jgi:hypothetical protein
MRSTVQQHRELRERCQCRPYTPAGTQRQPEARTPEEEAAGTQRPPPGRDGSSEGQKPTGNTTSNPARTYRNEPRD